MVTASKTESDCLFYGWSFDGNRALCREGYTGAAGILAHLGNVDALLKQALAIASLDIFEIHGPADQIDQLREPLKGLNPTYFIMETGFRK